jgi:hypothetical protein
LAVGEKEHKKRPPFYSLECQALKIIILNSKSS